MRAAYTHSSAPDCFFTSHYVDIEEYKARLFGRPWTKMGGELVVKAKNEYC